MRSTSFPAGSITEADITPKFINYKVKFGLDSNDVLTFAAQTLEMKESDLSVSLGGGLSAYRVEPRKGKEVVFAAAVARRWPSTAP